MQRALFGLVLAAACGSGGQPPAEGRTQPTKVVRTTEAAPVPEETTPVEPPPPAGDPVPAAAPMVAAGAGHSCLLRAEGDVHCWGDNRFAQLGTAELPAEPASFRPRAARVHGIDDGVRIVAGLFHSCVLRRTGEVACFGHGGFGQLGDGALEDRPAPVTVTGLADAVEIAAGGEHSCARRASRHVVCWGGNARGQLGDGTTEQRLAPVEVTGLDDAIGIAAGRYHSCALRASGDVVCWGANTDGQLGDGSRSLPAGHRPTPAPVRVRDATGVMAGGAQTCVRLQNGRLACFGRNDSSQLGDGRGGRPEDVSLEPVAVEGVDNAPQIALGSHHSCMRLTTGGVRCVGYGRRGQLGEGGTTLRPSAVGVRGLESVLHVAAGVEHTCAVTSAGAVLCFGANDRGQLGDGTTQDRLAPAAVVDLPAP